MYFPVIDPIPLTVALSYTITGTLDANIVASMNECNDVIPDAIGSIYDVTMECYTAPVGQFLYVYMAASAAWLTLLEVEVFEGSKYLQVLSLFK